MLNSAINVQWITQFGDPLSTQKKCKKKNRLSLSVLVFELEFSAECHCFHISVPTHWFYSTNRTEFTGGHSLFSFGAFLHSLTIFLD